MFSGRARHLTIFAGAVGAALVVGCMSPTSSNSDGSLSASQAGQADHSGKKTTICHIPPGNPANMHTISVGNPAVPAHLAHGDKLGACGDVVNPPDTTVVDDGGGDHTNNGGDHVGGPGHDNDGGTTDTNGGTDTTSTSSSTGTN